MKQFFKTPLGRISLCFIIFGIIAWINKLETLEYILCGLGLICAIINIIKYAMIKEK